MISIETDPLSDPYEVPWYQMPLPRRWHRCKTVATSMLTTEPMSGTIVNRCACGAIRIDDGRWFLKNDRRNNT